MAKESIFSGLNNLNVNSVLDDRYSRFFGFAHNQFLMQSVSYFDTATEGFYHGLMLGFSALLGNHYEITSNVEAGNGRYDIMLKPFDKRAGVWDSDCIRDGILPKDMCDCQ